MTKIDELIIGGVMTSYKQTRESTMLIERNRAYVNDNNTRIQTAHQPTCEAVS